MMIRVLISTMILLSISPSLFADDFLNNIDQHYEELIDLYKAKRYEKLLEKVETFRDHLQMNYKDVRLIHKKTKTAFLFEKVKKIPSSEVAENLSLYRQLLDLNPENDFYKKKFEYYHSKYSDLPKEKKILADWGGNNNIQTSRKTPANEDDIREAQRFRYSLPNACSDSYITTEKDGSVAIHIRCQDGYEQTKGLVVIKNRVVKKIR